MWRPTDLLERLHETPFRPVAFYDSLNRRYEIHQPDLAMVGERSITIGVPSSQKGVYIHTVCVSLDHIVRWENLPSSDHAPADGNGSSPQTK